MSTLVTVLWWVAFGPLIAAELVISVPIGLGSGALAYLDEGLPVKEPFWIVHGPRYYSSKLDYPLIDVSQWLYFGDEPENPPPYCARVVSVDENSWTFKWTEMPDTENLRGDESRGEEQYNEWKKRRAVDAHR